MKKTTPTSIEALRDAAIGLTRGLSADDRYARLLESVVQAIPCDAATLLRLEAGLLRPVAVCGLSPDVLGRVFDPLEEPRLAAILASRGPVEFAASDPLPDPFDGFVLGARDGDPTVHSCTGASLWVGTELVGALTLDALEPGRFAGLDIGFFSAFAALAAAALQLAALIESLERTANLRGELARELVTDAFRREGGALLGVSEEMNLLRREVDTVAASDLAVLITGETGTGKELVARTVHARSGRAQQPLIYVNCAALPESIAESELFGHVRGAFTGAVAARSGKFELADGGTLFLDEVGELPFVVQAKLLRALQFGEIQRVGSDQPRNVDVRVVAATNRDLASEVKAGRFRGDLFHRLAMYPIHAPPLRGRHEDITLLAGHFLDRARIRLGSGTIRLRPDAIAELRSYGWPGNVRELDHVVTRAALRAVALADGGSVWVNAAILDVGPSARLAVDSATAAVAPEVAPLVPLREAIDSFRAGYISRAVTESEGNWAEAARRLGVDRGNLHRTAQRLGLKADD